LIDVLDRPAEALLARGGRSKSVNEYRAPMNDDPHGEVVIRALSTGAASDGDLQEIAVAMRTTADIRRVFTYQRTKTIVMRGTAEEVALGEWLVQQLDKSATGGAEARGSQSSSMYRYDTPYESANMVKVVFVPQFTAIKNFQEFATQVRIAANMRRVFTYNAPRAIALRGTIDQIAIADRMVRELDGLQ
jgi:hypothetical protein